MIRKVLYSLMLAAGSFTLSGADNALIDHGIAAPVSLSRGASATMNSNNERILVIRQTDIGKLLTVNIDTGESRQFDLPGYSSRGANSFAVLHSRRNLCYGHVGPWDNPGTMYEFDPESMSFTFEALTGGTYIMSYFEDSDGIIWGVHYPNAALISYDPESKVVTDHGVLNTESWPQYPRGGMARDSAGWVYTVIGFTKSQLLAYNPADGTKKALFSEEERTQTQDNLDGVGKVYLATDGQVYAYAKSSDGWNYYRLADGEAERLAGEPEAKAVQTRSASIWADFLTFDDGSKVTKLEVPYKRLKFKDVDGSERTMRFNYEAPGAKILNVVAGPDGGIYGSTTYPRFVFRFDPQSGEFFHHPDAHSGGHWNAWISEGKYLYGAFYPWGMIYEIDTTRPWTTEHDPELQAEDYTRKVKSTPNIHRPTTMIRLNDGRLLMGGTPDYGHTGGGLTIWNPTDDALTLIPNEKVIPNQSVIALAELPDGDIFAVTTVQAGTGGEIIADTPEFFIYNLENQEVIWQAPRPHIPGDVSSVFDALLLSNGTLCLADGKRSKLLIFDPAKREIIQEYDLTEYGNLPDSVGNGFMQRDKQERLIILLNKALIRFNPATGEIEKLTDLATTAGGAIALIDDKVYFGSGSHLWSFTLPEEK